MQSVDIESFETRLAGIESRIAAACERAGRDPAEVLLVGVSKTHPPETIDEALSAGLRTFGESRVQEAAAKIPLCAGNSEWHLIGHLQRNKVRPALELFDMLHGVDSIRLIEALASAVAESGHCPDLLLEVNVAGESSKFGFAPEEVPEALRIASELGGLAVRGLMAIPPFVEEPEAARPYFRKLAQVREQCQDMTGLWLPQLSMGMSNDFEVAVEEGATIVRVGTALFGPRQGWKPARNLEDV
jgi:pyridoxal phosphate enzyme (YggS family)